MRPVEKLTKFKVVDWPEILCTVSPHTARCPMAFEEVAAVPPTPQEVEGDEHIETFMEECAEALLFGRDN
jgi:hypothetical protein